MSVDARPRKSLRGVLGDVALAVTLLMIGQSEVWGPWRIGGIGTAEAPVSRPVAAVMIVVFTLPLIWRRRRPLTVAFVICTALAVQVLIVAPQLSLLAGLLPLLIVDYSAAAYGVAGRRGFGLAAVLAVEAVFIARIPEERASGEILFGLFVIVGYG